MIEPASFDEPQRSALDRLLVGGMAWTAILRWSAQIVSWIGTAAAARLLTPGDYGLIGMAMLAIGFLRLVEDFGMDAVLVQDRTIEGAKQAQVSGLLLATGVVLTAVFMALSVPIAAFFKEPQVAVLIVALSFLCLGDAIQVIPRALLQREMQFRKLAGLQFLQVVATQTVLVTLAYLGWGVWSLVFNSLAGMAVVTLTLLWLRPYKVGWPADIRQLSKPLLQGWRILASRFASYAYGSADQAVIGRMLGKDALGTYSFAMTFSTTISQEMSAVFSRVVPGVFSTIQHQRDELRRYFLLLTELLCFIALPVSFGMAVTADLVVAIVLGPNWTEVVTPLRILCLYGAFYSCQVLIGHLLLWTGRFRANMWCSILAGVVMPVSFFVGAHWGLIGIAWTWVIAFPLLELPAFIIAFNTIRIGPWTWVRSFGPALIASGIMVAGVLAVRTAMPVELPTAVLASLSVAAGALLYAATFLLFFRARLAALWQFIAVLRGGAEPTRAVLPPTESPLVRP